MNITMELIPYSNDLIADEALPAWMENCPLVSGWCRYNGRVFYADLNYEKSEQAQRPVFDLAYCATKAMNGIYLLTRPWDANKFKRWANNSNW